MMASGIWERGEPGLLYWLRTGLPVSFSIAALSKKPRAAGVAMTWTVQPRSWRRPTKAPRAVAGPAPQATTDRTRPWGSWVDGRAAGDFLGGDFFGGAQGDVGLLVAAPLQERAGGVDEQAGFAFGHGDGAQVDAAGDVDGGARVAEGDGDVDPVLASVDGPKAVQRRLPSAPRRWAASSASASN